LVHSIASIYLNRESGGTVVLGAFRLSLTEAWILTLMFNALALLSYMQGMYNGFAIGKSKDTQVVEEEDGKYREVATTEGMG